MNDSEIISWLMNALLALGLWIGKTTVNTLQDQVKNVQNELDEFTKIHTTDLQQVRQNYLHRDDFREFKDELRSVFTEIRQDLKDLKNRV